MFNRLLITAASLSIFCYKARKRKNGLLEQSTEQCLPFNTSSLRSYKHFFDRTETQKTLKIVEVAILAK
jgi:hypothetical protein